MLIPCPVCGLRDHGEFTYFGDATVTRPDVGDADQGRWAAYIYDRNNPRGAHREYWHHIHGCRHWLEVTRDTLDHDIAGAKLVGPWAEKAAPQQEVNAAPVNEAPGAEPAPEAM